MVPTELDSLIFLLDPGIKKCEGEKHDKKNLHIISIADPCL